MYKLTAIILVQLFFNLSHYSADRRMIQYQFRELVSEGLSGGEITGIVQDAKGYLWIGTPTGLICYDGYRSVLVKDIPAKEGGTNANVQCLETDKAGHLWIGRDFDHLAVLNLTTGRFLKLGCPTNSGALFSVTAIRPINNYEIWTGTRDGAVYRIQYAVTGNDSIVLSPKRIALQTGQSHSLVKAIVPFAGKMLIGYRESGLVAIDAGMPGNPVRNTVVDAAPINCLFVDSRGLLWAGTASGAHAYRYVCEKQSIEAVSIPFSDPTSRANVVAIAEDAHQNLFIGTENNGFFTNRIYEFDVSERQQLVNYVRENSSLISNQLTALFIDRSNMLWVGTRNDGVALTDLSRKRFFSRDKYGSKTSCNELSAVFQDSRLRVWFASVGDGLFCLDRRTETLYHKPESSFDRYPGTRFNQIFEDRDGNVWFCSATGLYYLPKSKEFNNETTLRKINDEAFTQRVWAIEQDEYGSYWVGTTIGLYRVTLNLAHNRVTAKTTYLPNIHSGVMSTGFAYFLKHTEKNTLWSGTAGEGMYRVTYNNRDESISVDKYTTSGHDGFYINNKTVWSIHYYNDSIWACTDEGISVYARDTANRYVYLRSWTAANGLPSNRVKTMLADSLNNLWLVTANGLSKFQDNRHTFVNYSYTNGLLSNTLTCGAKEPHLIFLGTSKGLAWFCPYEIGASGFRPRTLVTGLMVNNEEVSPGSIVNGQAILDQEIAYSEEIRLSHKNNNITLQFSAFNFAQPEANQYSYILEGYDKQWTSTDNHQNSATYTNLPSGAFVFKVKTTNADGISDEAPAMLKITILPPPWKTWWAYSFYLLAIAVVVRVVVAFYRKKVRLKKEELLRKQQREQERQLAATEDEFVKEAIRVVTENMGNPDFNIEKLSEGLAMSRMQLHRKLKGTVNMSASEFVRSIRLKHAAELLSAGNYRVSEVMFKTGFSDSSHFARVFKQQFGKTPGEWMESGNPG